MDHQVNCERCAHFEKINGRIIYARCMKKSVFFHARGVTPLEDERINPETFTCEHAKPKEAAI